MFGKSRQAYYKSIKASGRRALEEELVIQLVKEKRRNKPRTGVRKLHIELQKDFERHGIKVGRDKLFDILRRNQMLVKKRKLRARTTNSYHMFHKYPNLAKDLPVSSSNQLWVSDITYIKVGEEFNYLFLITDSYSRKIVGWHLSDSLATQGAVKALKMAINTNKLRGGLVHHSDRGVQYCSLEYVRILNKNKIVISMTENSDPRENAIAERVNGILKDEWLNDIELKNTRQAKRILSKIIHTYNTERLHCSLDYQTPEQVHEQYEGNIKKRWKSYYKNKVNDIYLKQKQTIKTVNHF